MHSIGSSVEQIRDCFENARDNHPNFVTHAHQYTNSDGVLVGMFDFTFNETSGQIEKACYYSHCENHEATREEVLLWRRVQDLERIIEDRRPAHVRAFLDKLPTDADRIRLNPSDFAMLREHARDRILFVTQAALIRKRILGEIPVIRDGEPSTVWIIVDRDVPASEIRIERTTPD